MALGAIEEESATAVDAGGEGAGTVAAVEEEESAAAALSEGDSFAAACGDDESGTPSGIGVKLMTAAPTVFVSIVREKGAKGLRIVGRRREGPGDGVGAIISWCQ